MSDVITTDHVSAEAVEHILGTGDLSKLTTHQRVEYYAAVCKSVGLNPLTRPFRFMSFQGQTVMYATRDCTDQLRQIRKISIAITDKRLDGDLFIVTAQATAADGRRDEDVGAVTIGKLIGEARANATMKAMTKAKRRVTLSICGLGMLSEDEVETLAGATTFAHDAALSDRDAINAEIPMRAAAAPAPRPARKAEQPTKPITDYTEEQLHAWAEKLRAACAVLYSKQEVVEIGNRKSVGDMIATGPEWLQREISSILAEAYARFPEEEETSVDDDPFAPGLEIHGEAKLAAG